MLRLLPIVASLVLLALPTAAHAYTFYEWEALGGPTGIAQQGTGPLTVTFNGTGEVGAVALGGVQSARTTIAGAATAPEVLVAGPGDGNLWFVDTTNGRVGRTDPGVGPVTLTTAISGDPTDLVASANNLIWVVESDGGELDCIEPDGDVTAKASGLDEPVAITRANDGALWYVDTTANEIARLAQPANCDATIAPAVFSLGTGAAPVDVTAAPTGNDVFVAGANGLVRVTPAGTPTPVAAGNARPHALHANATGVWWVDATNKRIGRYAGTTVTEWALPLGYGVPIDFALASDGSLWYTATDRIGRFSEDVGPQGPAGEPGAPGTPGAPGAPGAAGQQGAQGEKGDQGTSILGAPGANGAAGPAGPAGARGATGAAGPRGKTGPAAKIPRISCRLSGSRVICRVAGKGGSGGSGDSGGSGGTNTGGGEGLRLRLSCAKTLYATGSRAAKSTRTSVRLHALRKLKPGNYTLVVSVGEDVTVRIPLKLR